MSNIGYPRTLPRNNIEITYQSFTLESMEGFALSKPFFGNDGAFPSIFVMVFGKRWRVLLCQNHFSETTERFPPYLLWFFGNDGGFCSVKTIFRKRRSVSLHICYGFSETMEGFALSKPFFGNDRGFPSIFVIKP